VPRTKRRPRLHYERRGEGEPLLWVTGFGISAAVFEPVLAPYAERFECITYDNRGSGRSDAPVWPTSMPQLAADAARLLDELELESAHVYGLSMGGMIAQELAIRFPERVRGLVLGCSTTGGPRAIRPTLGELAALSTGAARMLGEPGRPWRAPLVFSGRFRREHPERAAELVRNFDNPRSPLRGHATQFIASVYHDTFNRLPRIQAPTLVLHGRRDRLTPLVNARMIADRIPDGELQIVPGAGHAYLLEDPERGGKRPPAVIVLLSDGANTAGTVEPEVAAREARRLKVPIDTVALGTPDGLVTVPGLFGDRTVPVPPDPDTLRAIARISGGRFFAAPDADELKSVYADLGSRIGFVREREEVTVAFAGGGLLFLLLAAALSLRWFNRLP
jgi:3-oxoadipate enol-lactonase